MSTTVNPIGTTNFGDIGSLMNPPAAPAATSDLTDKNVFLQLLVAQLKNQNPENPTDGTEFVSELAQFTQLEQTMSISSDVGSIKSLLTTAYAGTAAADTTTSGTTAP